MEDWYKHLRSAYEGHLEVACIHTGNLPGTDRVRDCTLAIVNSFLNKEESNGKTLILTCPTKGSYSSTIVGSALAMMLEAVKSIQEWVPTVDMNVEKKGGGRDDKFRIVAITESEVRLIQTQGRPNGQLIPTLQQCRKLYRPLNNGMTKGAVHGGEVEELFNGLGKLNGGWGDIADPALLVGNVEPYLNENHLGFLNTIVEKYGANTILSPAIKSDHSLSNLIKRIGVQESFKKYCLFTGYSTDQSQILQALYGNVLQKAVVVIPGWFDKKMLPNNHNPYFWHYTPEMLRSLSQAEAKTSLRIERVEDECVNAAIDEFLKECKDFEKKHSVRFYHRKWLHELIGLLSIGKKLPESMQENLDTKFAKIFEFAKSDYNATSNGECDTSTLLAAKENLFLAISTSKSKLSSALREGGRKHIIIPYTYDSHLNSEKLRNEYGGRWDEKLIPLEALHLEKDNKQIIGLSPNAHGKKLRDLTAYSELIANPNVQKVLAYKYEEELLLLFDVLLSNAARNQAKVCQTSGLLLLNEVKDVEIKQSDVQIIDELACTEPDAEEIRAFNWEDKIDALLKRPYFGSWRKYETHRLHSDERDFLEVVLENGTTVKGTPSFEVLRIENGTRKCTSIADLKEGNEILIYKNAQDILQLAKRYWVTDETYKSINLASKCWHSAIAESYRVTEGGNNLPALRKRLGQAGITVDINTLRAWTSFDPSIVTSFPQDEQALSKLSSIGVQFVGYNVESLETMREKKLSYEISLGHALAKEVNNYLITEKRGKRLASIPDAAFQVELTRLTTTGKVTKIEYHSES